MLKDQKISILLMYGGFMKVKEIFYSNKHYKKKLIKKRR